MTVLKRENIYSGNSRKRSIQFKKIWLIVIAWMFIGVLVTVYDHFSIQSGLSAGYAPTYSFLKSLVFNLAAAFMGSFFGGLWLVLYVNEKARDKPYGITLLLVAVSFFVIVSCIAVVLGIAFVTYETGNWPFVTTLATEAFYESLSNPLHVKNILIWGNVVLLTQFMLQMNDKFGQGLLWSFVIGKYHRPQQETRVFMFLDLISSTTIAEKLGNEQYYSMLRDFFADVTNAIIYNKGEIYQYVGDEIIISWKYSTKEVQHDCLNCYFDIRKRIYSLSDKYSKKYGLIPDFKAAMHFGGVTAGEIGIIKKELTYSGDVLNTTARIMTQCKVYNRKLLISGKLHDYLKQQPDYFLFEKMGEEYLRGKAAPISIYAVSNQSAPLSLKR